jgi:hypothetical protein
MRQSVAVRSVQSVCLALVFGASCVASEARAADLPAPPPSIQAPPPADFKLAIAFYGIRKEPITSAELIVRSGTAYYFASESPEEIVIINPTNRRIELLDLERKIQAEMPFARLEEKQKALHRAIAGAIQQQEEAGGRSNRVSAEMSRALNDPALAETYDPATSRVQLQNSAVTVDATGAPEPDAARLTLIDTALGSLIQLASARDAEAIPPFIRLDALHALTVGHHLRPTELAFTYRLAGPPRKHRWTYQLVESLTARELLALDRVARLRTNTPFVPFERYERRPASSNKPKSP